MMSLFLIFNLGWEQLVLTYELAGKLRAANAAGYCGTGFGIGVQSDAGQ